MFGMNVTRARLGALAIVAMGALVATAAIRTPADAAVSPKRSSRDRTDF